jgi:hypothetical protein
MNIMLIADNYDNSRGYFNIKKVIINKDGIVEIIDHHGWSTTVGVKDYEFVIQEEIRD